MNKVMVIAWRNLWRTPRRSIVTIGAMTVAVLSMLLYASLVEGYVRDLEADLVEVEVGDLQIHAEGYRDRPSLYTTIDDSRELVAALENAGFAATTRLLAGGLVAAGESSSGALIKGVDVATNASVSAIAERVDRGQWLSVSDPHGAVLGRGLARALAVAVGDELIVLGQATDGSMANELFQVRGILEAVTAETDHAGVLIVDSIFRGTFALEQGVHQVLVRRPAQLDLDAASALAQATVSGHEVKTWRQLQPLMSQMIDTSRSMIILMFVVMYVAIAILILNAMLMSVFERIRELGVMKAVGLQPRTVLSLVLTEAMLQAIVATMIALVVGSPLLWLLVERGIDVSVFGDITAGGMSIGTRMFGAVAPHTILGPIVTFFVLVFLGVLYPGLKAARLRPVEAMRHR